MKSSEKCRGRRGWTPAIVLMIGFLSLWNIFSVQMMDGEMKFETRQKQHNAAFNIDFSNSSHNKTDVKTSNKTSARKDIDKNIVIRMPKAKRDRLASNVDRPLKLMAYAHCYRQTFCIEEFSPAMEYFQGFVNLTCPEDLTKQMPVVGVSSDMFKNPPIKKPGVHDFAKRIEKLLSKWTEDHKECGWDLAMRQKWREILSDAVSGDNPKARNATLLSQELFETSNDPKVVTVAIQIRRGDYKSVGRKVILDQFFVILLRHLRSILEKAGRSPEVHLFSEDFGMIDIKRKITRNWTMYDGLVDHFHFAPDFRGTKISEGNEHLMGLSKKPMHFMDIDLNLRDWRHFLKADILVAGSHFSYTPALARWQPPDPETGLPLTITLRDNKNVPKPWPNQTMVDFGWSEHDYGQMPDKYELLNIPPALAKFDTVPVESFMKDLMVDWNATYNN